VLTNHHDGKRVQPFHEQTVCTQNPTPSWDESHHDLALKGGDAAWQKTSQYTSGHAKRRACPQRDRLRS
jgi:hypothetical protein